MKSLFKIFVALLITVGFLNAQALEQNGEKNGYDINLSSQKSVIVGNNSFDIKLSKDGVAITDAKVKLKVFTNACWSAVWSAAHSPISKLVLNELWVVSK